VPIEGAPPTPTPEAKTRPTPASQRPFANYVEISKVWFFALGGGHMVSINEELELAKAAKGAVKALLTATSKPAVLATLKDAYRAAVLNLSSGGGLNAARAKVGIALSNITHGLPTKEKINEVTSTIDVWITELEGSLFGDHYAKPIRDDN
jgi:hypothetical protein